MAALQATFATHLLSTLANTLQNTAYKSIDIKNEKPNQNMIVRFDALMCYLQLALSIHFSLV